MGRLADIQLDGSSAGDRDLIKKLFGEIEIQAYDPGSYIRKATIKRVTNLYADSTGKAPLFLFAPKDQEIAKIWPEYDLSRYQIIRFGTTYRIAVSGLFLSLKESKIGIYIFTKPEGIELEDRDSYGI